MSLLISAEALDQRRAAVRDGGSLAPLAASLRRDLQRVLDVGFQIPTAKALLSREGGRCPRHGIPLAFDPYRPHEHVCPVDGEVFRGERHDRAWIMWYQLWLAERAVHAAALFALAGERVLATLASDILTGYAEQYLRYPNRDNVLGPTRPFFSTYLESIWLLQLCAALDLLELSGGATAALSGTVRDRIIEPSVALITSYDEGASNRQVWNDAAILAGNLLRERQADAMQAIVGRSGLLAHLGGSLLPDGTWYEGENYHLFAHRGLWYGVVMAERMGFEIPPPLVARFEEGFASPLATALPDYTLPSRRDSQYAISLRQWRFAESCELGLARREDERLVGALWELYEEPEEDVPRRDPGRWRSTAESERNEPASLLSRADLGWRSLLLAREVLPPLEPVPRRSVLLDGQGIAILRRSGGATYFALDYGHSGGGHGHPDRLNVLLAHGYDRWLDDMGTGSYVDATLHWYRSTLAHNAPLIDGRSQQRVNGVLRAFYDRADMGWVDAEVPLGGLAPGVRVRRSLVVMPGYAIDRVEWESDREVRFELPLHVRADLAGIGPFRDAPLTGGSGVEDGFAFVRNAAVASVAAEALVQLERDGQPIGWAVASEASEWWRAIAPAAPGHGEERFALVRMHGHRGVVVIVWDWGAPIVRITVRHGAPTVELADGSCHVHTPSTSYWQVTLFARGVRSVVELEGIRPLPRPGPRAPEDEMAVSDVEPELVRRAPAPPLVYELGRASYRISEESWDEAGRPRATVSLGVERSDLVIDVNVCKTPVVFRAADAPDPALDNEHPDIHSDGIQLYIAAPAWTPPAAWLAVPDERGGGAVRIRLVDGARADIPLQTTWQRTNAGYRMRFVVPLAVLGDCRENPIGLDVVVNDMAPGRERRRGQLVLSGGEGEYVYLRGDRESPTAFRQFLLPRV